MARIGIAGAGLLGRLLAWQLSPHHDVTVFDPADGPQARIDGQGPAASVTYTAPGGGGGGVTGGTNFGPPPDDGENTDPDGGPNPGGPSAPPLPGTDEDGDGLPDPWTPNDDPNNVPGRPCSGCVQLFPAPHGDADGDGDADDDRMRPTVTSSPPGSNPGTITVTTGSGATIVILCE